MLGCQKNKIYPNVDFRPVIVCKVGKRGGLDKCGQDMKIIFFFFFLSIAKVLVVTGSPYDIGKYLEVIDLTDSTLENDVFEEKTMQRYGCYGGILQNQLFICGGFDPFFSEKCKIVLPKYKECFQLLETRINASSVQINQDTLWITGSAGSNTEDPDKKTTELVSLNQPTVNGIELPFSIHSHSMVSVDQYTIYLIGSDEVG